MVVWKPFQETLHLVSLVPKQKINFRIHAKVLFVQSSSSLKYFMIFLRKGERCFYKMVSRAHTSIIHASWSISFSPGKSGQPVQSSTRMHPKLHISIGVPYGIPAEGNIEKYCIISAGWCTLRLIQQYFDRKDAFIVLPRMTSGDL